MTANCWPPLPSTLPIPTNPAIEDFATTETVQHSPFSVYRHTTSAHHLPPFSSSPWTCLDSDAASRSFPRTHPHGRTIPRGFLYHLQSRPLVVNRSRPMRPAPTALTQAPVAPGLINVACTLHLFHTINPDQRSQRRPTTWHLPAV